MQPFNFKLVPNYDKSATVPVSVAGQMMVDVQNLLMDIGSMMVRQELRLQNAIPESLVRRFSLSIDTSFGRNVETVTEGEDTLMLDALNQLIRELELANMTEGRGESGSHRETLARRKLSADLLALADHLDGYDLYYGSGDDMRRFRLTRANALREIASDGSGSLQGAIIGVISQNPTRKNCWLITNGIDTVPITFASNISSMDISLFAGAGPLIASGTVVTDPDGTLKEMRAVIGCYSFPSIRFHRVITPKRDIILLNPVEAIPGYNTKGLWTLDCEDLGISVAKPSWDECVIAFHAYFTFLWETYAESDSKFEGEEQDVRELLLSMALVSAERAPFQGSDTMDTNRALRHQNYLR